VILKEGLHPGTYNRGRVRFLQTAKTIGPSSLAINSGLERRSATRSACDLIKGNIYPHEQGEKGGKGEFTMSLQSNCGREEGWLVCVEGRSCQQREKGTNDTSTQRPYRQGGHYAHAPTSGRYTGIHKRKGSTPALPFLRQTQKKKTGLGTTILHTLSAEALDAGKKKKTELRTVEKKNKSTAEDQSCCSLQTMRKGHQGAGERGEKLR